MKTEHQRIALAKLCGWTVARHTGLMWHPVLKEARFVQNSLLHKTRLQLNDNDDSQNVIPDYLNDLNAIREIEESLDTLSKARYVSILRNICAVEGGWSECASARQRAKAILGALDLWVD